MSSTRLWLPESYRRGEEEVRARGANGQRKAGERQLGDTKVAHLDVQFVNLDNSDPSAGKVPTVQIDVC